MDTVDAKVIPYHKSNRGRTVKSVPKQPQKRAAGRKAFQGEYCEIHSGLDENGEVYIRFDSDGNEVFGGTGCAKFSHLDTTGRGLAKLPFWRTFLATFTKSLKPLFIALLAIGLFYIATHFVGRALHIGNGLSGPTQRTVPGSVRPSPSNSVHHRGIGPTGITVGNDRRNDVQV